MLMFGFTKKWFLSWFITKSSRKMSASLGDQHLEFWHQLVKNDVGSKRFHIPSLVFYLVGLGIFLFNLITHFVNGAYLGFGLTVGIHFLSAWLISWFYRQNESVIDEDNVTFERNEKTWSWFRKISQGLGITPLFRICANWEDQDKRHETVRMQRILRRDIDEEEIHAVVVNKKRQIVKAYFDCIDAFFKTIPQCILQIYIALDLDLPLRFCTMTDVTRLVTIFWSILAASRATANYSMNLTEYLKALEFQDFFMYGLPVNLSPPKRHLFWLTFLVNFAVIGTRIFVMAHLLTFGGLWTPALLFFLLVLYWIWIRINAQARPCYENPPAGIVTKTSEFVNRFINVFCYQAIKPGFRTTLFHQGIFMGASAAIKAVVFQANEITSTTSSILDPIITPLNSCNFSLFSNSRSKISRIVHQVLNTDWSDSVVSINATGSVVPSPSFTNFQFKEIFIYQSVCIGLLIISLMCSLFYTTYVKCFRTHGQKFPLQISFRAWEGFLGLESGESLEKVLRILLLGVLETPKLELLNYRLPEDVLMLKEIVHFFVEDHNQALASTRRFRRDKNPCDKQLRKMQDFLVQRKAGEEAEVLSIYFRNSFYLCMTQMTSHRIAQTANVLNSNGKSVSFLSNFNFWVFS